MKPGTEVQLTADLTDYHPGLKVGTVGIVIDPVRGALSIDLPQFVCVDFGPGIGRRNWDILRKSLRVTGAQPTEADTHRVDGFPVPAERAPDIVITSEGYPVSPGELALARGAYRRVMDRLLRQRD